MTLKDSLLAIAVIAGLAGCADGNAWFDDRPCYFPDTPSAMAPAWICHSRDGRNLITAVGYAPRSSAGRTFSKQMALADARVKLAQRVQGRCGVNRVSEAMLVNSRLMDSQRSPRDNVYVQVGIRPSDLRLDCR